MNKWVPFYVGSYTQMITEDFGGNADGFYAAKLCLRSGEIVVEHCIKTENPSYLCLNADKNLIYTFNELAEPQNPMIEVYRVGVNHQFTLVNQQPIPGDYPCHIALIDNHAIVSCYGSGNFCCYPLAHNGSLYPIAENVTHYGKSSHAVRQQGAHCHQAVAVSQDEFYIADLGIDQIQAYQFKSQQVCALPLKNVNLPAGSGPRHAVFHRSGERGYVINELLATVSVIEKTSNGYLAKDTYGMLNPSATPSGSAIKLSPCERYLYVANRGNDTINIFEIKGNELLHVDEQQTQGKTLRDFAISNCGTWLVAAFQDSNELVSHKIIHNGKLEQVFSTRDAISPVCVVF